MIQQTYTRNPSLKLGACLLRLNFAKALSPKFGMRAHNLAGHLNLESFTLNIILPDSPPFTRNSDKSSISQVRCAAALSGQTFESSNEVKMAVDSNHLCNV